MFGRTSLHGLAGADRGGGIRSQARNQPALVVIVGLLLGLTVHFWRKPLPFAAIVAMRVRRSIYCFNYEHQTIHLVRNFFGVLNVAESADGRFRVLWHGTTGQGAQRIRDDDGNPLKGRPEMVSEFFDGAGIAQVFDAVQRKADGPINYAVIGLGTGALACRAARATRVTFYEIDPDIVRIARDPKLFRLHLGMCAGRRRSCSRRRAADAGGRAGRKPTT